MGGLTVEPVVTPARIRSRFGTNDLFDIRSLLGQRYREYSRDLTDRVEKIGLLPPEKQTVLLQRTFTPEELESYYFFDRMGNVIGRPFKGLPEFIAFLSENYIKGQPYFDRHMGKIFDPSEYQKVYDFTKDLIFRGREYSIHPFDLQSR